jgi:2-keto-3-deoxy-L-rhamnonate aldolase RhmA
VNNIEELARVPGLDAIIIGPYDLSASLGQIGQVNHPEVVDAINHVTEVCQEAEIVLGIVGLTAEAVKPYIEKGFSLIIAGVDTVMLGQAGQAILTALK